MHGDVRQTDLGTRILHHGASEGVTGSCHELVIDEANSILVDCGLFQGAEVSGAGASSGRPEIDFDIGRVRALVLTHCHLDHVGRVPYLLAAGFRGSIYCSAPTAALLPVVMEDALEVGFTRDRQLIRQFLELLASRVVPLPYGVWSPVALPPDSASGLDIRLQPAGHILGSAYVDCRVRHSRSLSPNGDDVVQAGTASVRSRPVRVVFSGDLGAPYSPLLPAPKPPYEADVLVIEATYGDRLHEGRRTRRERLKALVERCFRDRGVLLIPAFSIGRTQELLYELEDIIHRHATRRATPDLQWQDLEIVVDSPLAARFTEKYRALRDFWDREARRRSAAGRHPLSFEQLTTIEDHQTHLDTVEYLRKSGRPTIVIAGSGMCNGGRIVNYLKALLGDARTDVLFVGYQAEGTPGRIIQQYGPRNGYVELDGARYTIRAGVHTLNGYSAHADQKDLVNFVRRMRHKPREIRIVHGDRAAKEALREKLKALLPQSRIVVAGNGAA